MTFFIELEKRQKRNQNKTKRSHMKTHKIPSSQINWEQKEQF